jgi:hypothetical protein
MNTDTKPCLARTPHRGQTHPFHLHPHRLHRLYDSWRTAAARGAAVGFCERIIIAALCLARRDFERFGEKFALPPLNLVWLEAVFGNNVTLQVKPFLDPRVTKTAG